MIIIFIEIKIMIKMMIIIMEYSASGGVAAVGGDGCCQCLLHTPARPIIVIIIIKAIIIMKIIMIIRQIMIIIMITMSTPSANCLSVGEELIFIGCGEGLVRCFSPHTLQVGRVGHDDYDDGENNGDNHHT